MDTVAPKLTFAEGRAIIAVAGLKAEEADLEDVEEEFSSEIVIESAIEKLLWKE